MSYIMRYSEDEIKTWKALNQINLTEFFQRTMPTFVMIDCRLNLMNCKSSWKLRQTYEGRCLELNTAMVIDKAVEKENNEIRKLYSGENYKSVRKSLKY